MISRLGPTNILHNHGRHVLISAQEDLPLKSWFLSLRKLSQQYRLKDPLLVLQSPTSKNVWKKLCKSRVTDWWEKKLRAEAELLQNASLLHFKPAFMSLSSPHPLWTSAGSPYEVGKAVVASQMLSGRYRTDRLTRHWNKSNPDGLCRLPGCLDQEGSLEHILLHCQPYLMQDLGLFHLFLHSWFPDKNFSLLFTTTLLKRKIFFCSSFLIHPVFPWLFLTIKFILTP